MDLGRKPYVQRKTGGAGRIEVCIRVYIPPVCTRVVFGALCRRLVDVLASIEIDLIPLLPSNSLDSVKRSMSNVDVYYNSKSGTLMGRERACTARV